MLPNYTGLEIDWKRTFCLYCCKRKSDDLVRKSIDCGKEWMAIDFDIGSAIVQNKKNTHFRRKAVK